MYVNWFNDITNLKVREKARGGTPRTADLRKKMPKIEGIVATNTENRYPTNPTILPVWTHPQHSLSKPVKQEDLVHPQESFDAGQ
ncbi:hypothetical protein FQR65_LT11928 [Abscondita terminalis]|nr:hypothetical protein FQR65_LT11928 [Abscondita terminalis]